MTASLVVAILAVFGTVAYVMWTEGKIDRIPGSDLLSLTAAGSEPENFLIVGTDDRSDLPAEWDDTFGDIGGRRTDVIMVGHLVPGERIQLLSIPRDLKVDIPGHGTNRINAAYVFGGPDLLVETQFGGNPVVLFGARDKLFVSRFDEVVELIDVEIEVAEVLVHIFLDGDYRFGGFFAGLFLCQF